MLPLYRNQSTDLHSKSIDIDLHSKSFAWFLYEGKTGT